MTPLEEMQYSFGQMFLATQLAWSDEPVSEARASATPQAMYGDLAATCPVTRTGDGHFRVASMDDVRAVTRSRDVLQGVRFLGSDRPAIPLGLDGPDHKKYRAILDPVFAPRKIEGLAAPIANLADQLIDEFIDDGSVDAYARWCEPLPSSIFLAIMGLPMEDLDDFLRFKRLALGQDVPADDATPEERLRMSGEAIGWIVNYLSAALDEREAESSPRDDVLGWLMTAEVDGHRLTRQELLDIIGLLMAAGLDTVTASLACFLSFLARHPDHRRSLVEDPDLTRSAVEELLRFESPVSEGHRRTVADVETPSGTVIPAGSWVLVSWAAANMDPATFDEPGTVDFRRSPNPHIGFASGFHRCLGSHLARLELRVALDVWHRRIPDYRVAEGATLRYSDNPRSPHELPLVWS